MKEDLIIKMIKNDELESHQKVFLWDMWKMFETWKQIGCDLLPIPITEKTEIEIRKILNSMGKEILQIVDLMNKENNK